MRSDFRPVEAFGRAGMDDAAALHEVLGGQWRVRCEAAGGMQQQPRQQAQQRSAPVRKPPERPKPGEQAEPAGPSGDEHVPLPPEPQDDEDMYAEEPRSLPQAPPDPGAAAMKLLSDQLGARPLD